MYRRHLATSIMSISIRKMSALTEKSSSKCFGGYEKVFSHTSKVTNGEMRFAIFLPPQASTKKLPVIYFLSGVTMDHTTFMDKSGAQRYATEQGVILVAPDSSPHKADVPGENDKWYYGNKASWYIDSTEEPWCKRYKMYSYLTKELRQVINENFPVLAAKQSIIGHSAGGYGALLLTVRNPDMFVSTSALAPIGNPKATRRGVEAFEQYLGKDQSKWADWDVVTMLENYKGPPLRFLIDQGLADEYLSVNPKPTKDFLDACKKASIPVTYREHEGYDHHYPFVTTFIEDHIKYHMKFLNSAKSRL